MKLPIQLLLVSCVFFVSSAEACAERLVRAAISMHGKTILEGSTSDNGRKDADGVWEYLKSMRFQATKDFAELEIDPGSKVLSISAVKGQGGTIVVEIDCGGRMIARELKLVRLAVDRQGGEWSLDATQVDSMFSRRFIRRSDAARLENPKRLKR